MTELLITPDGLADLVHELRHLDGSGREAIAARLREAMATDANVPANGDHQDALEDLAALERRIATLRARIQSARVVEPDRSSDALEVGERVVVREPGTGATAEYELVGALEADPLARRVSILSPLGRALLGKRPGETAVVDAPRGRLHYEIVSIVPPAREGDGGRRAGRHQEGEP
jgi:transcription elongation factor GreA